MDYKPFADTGGGIGGESRGVDDAATNANFLLGDSGANNGGNSGDDSRDANGDKFDASIHIDPDKRNADGSFRRKRTRKSNSTSGGNRSKASNQASIDGLTRMLAIIHIGLASATKTPELKLEDDEAEALAKSTAVVLQEFDIRPDPKIEAIVGLVTTAGMIYGPRIYLISERKKKERMEVN